MKNKDSIEPWENNQEIGSNDMDMIVNQKSLLDKIEACKRKKGRWDDEVDICVLPNDCITTREEAIENAAYRICDAKVNLFDDYPDMKTCFEKEGNARINGMSNNPHQEQFLEPHIMKTFMTETWLGTSQGSDHQYRSPGYDGWVHAREYTAVSGAIHADKYKPTNPKHVGEYIGYVINEKGKEKIINFD